MNPPFAIAANSHLAAIPRRYPSPVAKAVVKRADPGETLLDYGCGYGHDKAFYERHGIPCRLYDPHYFPDYPEPNFKADIVVLAYVLNVVPAEARHAVLLDAWKFANRAIVTASVPKLKGRTSSRFTRFSIVWFRALVEVTLKRRTYAIAPNQFICFRDDDPLEVLSKAEVDQAIAAIQAQGPILPAQTHIQKQGRSFLLVNEQQPFITPKGERKHYLLGQSIHDPRYRWALAEMQQLEQVRRLRFNCKNMCFLDEFRRYPVTAKAIASQTFGKLSQQQSFR